MSAERIEIFDEGSQIRILCNGSVSTIISGPLGTHIEDAVIGAIRQQARDLDQLRTDLAAAVAAFANLDADRQEWITRAEQAEARLAAIEAAPTVACVSYVELWKVFVRIPDAPMPPIGTELIARPAKD